MLTMATRSVGMAILSATLALFVFTPLPSLASDRPPMKNGPSLTEKDALALIATAKTAKDHRKLAKYFNQEADQSEAAAKYHDQMIEAYRKAPGSDRMVEHCESLAKSNRDVAKAFREMATGHEEMAMSAK